LLVSVLDPGEHIMQEASAIDPQSISVGGLHQDQAPDPEVDRIARVLTTIYTDSIARDMTGSQSLPP